jgi:hypothetical protein
MPLAHLAARILDVAENINNNYSSNETIDQTTRESIDHSFWLSAILDRYQLAN